MKKVSLISVFILVFIVFLSLSYFANMQDCFNQLYKNLEKCQGLTDPTAKDYCCRGAFEVFNRCIANLSTQVGHPLYNSKLPMMKLYRVIGKPTLEQETFTIETSGVYYFNLFNGNETEKNTRVSSALITLNPDITVFSPNDFNKNVHLTVKSMYLEAGTYTLSSELRSESDTYIVLIISNVDFSNILNS